MNKFTPIYFSNRIKTINPAGWIGIITLWSKPEWVLDKMKEAGIDLSPTATPVAAIGTLYGNGLPQLLRNLLYNPQITHLILCGKDCSGSAKDLENFFKLGIEKTEFLKNTLYRIKETDRLIDSMVRPEDFQHSIDIKRAGTLKNQESIELLKHYIANAKRSPSPAPPRKKIPLPSVKINRFPSNPRNHNIVAEDALSAWQELIFRLFRFGHLIHLKKGDRQELQNVKVVVEKPGFIDRDKLEKFGFSPDDLMKYHDNFLNPDLPPDTTYTYGHRLATYFGLNTINQAAENLKKDPEDRKSYIALWDSSIDLTSPSGHPCLVSIYFRKFEQKLTLTATFRTHNSLDAWMKNFYGLLRVQKEVCKKTGIPPGAITVISHSISINPDRYQLAKSIAEQKPFSIKSDPLGNFYIEVKDRKIIVHHYYNGIKINQYVSDKASRLQHEIYRDTAISDINHAIYIGRMLEKAQICLKTGEDFVQE